MNKNTNSTGLGIVGALTILFIALKLCKVISWSWWWVLSPLWISVSIVFVIVLIIVLLTLIKNKN